MNHVIKKNTENGDENIKLARKFKKRMLGPGNHEPRIMKEFNRVYDSFRKTTGVFSLSEKSSNLLMWSRYGDQHSGVCIGFDSLEFPFNQCVSVNYRDFMPVLEFFNLESRETDLVEMMLTKHSGWSYEKEIRIVKPGVVGRLSISRNSVKRIIFGAKCPEVAENRIKNVIQHKRPDINLYKFEMSSNKYVLKVRKI